MQTYTICDPRFKSILTAYCDSETFLTHQDIADARAWIADCEWSDVEEVDELTNHAIVHGIERHYAGGWKQFLADQN